MKIRLINLSKNELAKLDAAERNLFFLVGHINNEVTSLAKIFGWCLAGADGEGEIERFAASAQAMIFARLMAGKLLEAWAALGKSWFASKVGQELSTSLHPEALMSLAALKTYFSSKNLIHSVRNSFAFHYNAEAVGVHWERAALEPHFELVLGITRGNSFQQASETVANVAVFHTINPANPFDGMATFLKELDVISDHFRNFCEGVTRNILERVSGIDLDTMGTLADLSPTKKYSEITIPVFYQPDADQAGILP